MKLPVALIFLAASELCTGERILFLAPIPSRSHFILTERLVEELAEEGHEVIVVAPFRKLKPIENVNEILIPDVSDSLLENSVGNSGKMRHMIPSLCSTSGGAEALIDSTMTHPSIVDLLNSQQTFDLVVGIPASAEGLLGGFAHRFKAPLVIVSTSLPSSSITEMVGDPAPSSFVSDGSLGFTDRLSFYQRILNFFHAIFSQIGFFWFYLPRQDRLMRKYFGGDVPPLKELLINNSLLLVNHHFSLGLPRPHLPNVIEIGGYHIRPAKPLPKDLESYVSEATDGFVYFSLGSSVKSDEFPEDKFEGIIKAFGNLSQRVLWKFDRESSSDLPGNVKISKWLPQSDVLAHPNLKLFITHGGLLSLTESISRGVPVVGIPMYPDQSVNINHIENLQVGVRLDFESINTQTFSNCIREVLNNSTYSENAKFRSRIFHDRPLPPIDTALYWMEYVMRYKGAPHLHSGALNLAWYQLYQLDVLVFIGVLFFLSAFVIHKICFGVFRKLRESGFDGISFLKKNN